MLNVCHTTITAVMLTSQRGDTASTLQVVESHMQANTTQLDVAVKTSLE